LLNSSESKSILKPFKGLAIPASAGSE
jgi:hypothetical protein